MSEVVLIGVGELGGVFATGLLRVGATVIPVRAQQETIALLYGDDPQGQPLPPLGPLQDFARRAGWALDDAFLALRGGSSS